MSPYSVFLIGCGGCLGIGFVAGMLTTAWVFLAQATPEPTPMAVPALAPTPRPAPAHRPRVMAVAAPRPVPRATYRVPRMAVRK